MHQEHQKAYKDIIKNTQSNGGHSNSWLLQSTYCIHFKSPRVTTVTESDVSFYVFMAIVDPMVVFLLDF
jgi:hypothetical protein